MPVFDLNDISIGRVSLGASSISVGQKVVLTVTWKNIGSADYAPQFRTDLKKGGLSALFETWKEGLWSASASTSPGAQTTVVVKSIAVPSDWGAGQTISVKLMLQGKEGPVREWDQVLQIPTATVPTPSADWVQIVGDVVMTVE